MSVHHHSAQQNSAVALRDPADVMRLARIGSFHGTRLSFVRSLMRRMIREQWTVDRTRIDLDDNGYGTCVYTVRTPASHYDFVAFSQYLDDGERSDRVIAEKWDTAFALVDGTADEATIARLRENVPLQEQGRCSARELVLSRANKSVRLFEHVTESLSAGHQPDHDFIRRIGYLMRTTAVYGNGKFGLADFDQVRGSDALAAPFRAQMLAVYLVRLFAVDLVEHVARRRAPDTAVPLSRALRRYIGVGNATGLGMAPFLVTHPRLLNQWMLQRETAIARVRSVTTADPAIQARMTELTRRAQRHIREIETSDEAQGADNQQLVDELSRLLDWQRTVDRLQPNDLFIHVRTHYGLECQELVNSILIECFPELVDGLAESMGAEETHQLDGQQSCQSLIDAIKSKYAWALAIDFNSNDSQHLFWYRSEDKEEPRLGERFNEPGADQEMIIGIGREVAQLHLALVDATAAGTVDANTPVARFLLQRPAFRGVVARVQNHMTTPYSEIHDNLIGAGCRPVDLLRCKLSMFGAGRFDPKSDRWTRITLFQGAPMPDELGRDDADDWAFPLLPEHSGPPVIQRQ